MRDGVPYITLRVSEECHSSSQCADNVFSAGCEVHAGLEVVQAGFDCDQAIGGHDQPRCVPGRLWRVGVTQPLLHQIENVSKEESCLYI